MNKIFKYSIFCFIALVGSLLSACSSDDDENVAAITGDQVYFSNALPSTIETPVSESSFDVTVKRVKTDDAISVPVKATMDEGSIYSLASDKVNFKTGESEAKITINYDPSKVVYGTYHSVTLSLDAAYTNEYGLASYTFKAGATEWQDFGTGKYRDDCVAPLLDKGNPKYDVEIQKSVVTEGVYRIKNAYTSKGFNDILKELGGTADTNNDYWITINASDPNKVYVTGGPTGINLGDNYGDVTVTSMVAYYLTKGKTLDEIYASHPEYFGTLKDGIITMPAKTLLVSFSNYENGAFYYGNPNGLFAVALPGSEIADYSLDYTTTGTFVDAKGKEYTCGTFTFGEDVSSVKYALTTDESQIEAVQKGLEDGTVEGYTASAAGDVRIPVEGTATYYLAAVIYNGTTAVGTSNFTIKFKSTKDNQEQWTALYTGTYTYSAQAITDKAQGLYKGTDDAVVLYQSQSDPNKYKLAPWCDSDEGLIFTKDATTGEFIVDNCDTGYKDDSYGEFYASCYKVLTGKDDYPCGYASDNDKKINFYLAYHIADGSNFGLVLETFEITGKADAAKVRKAHKANHASKVAVSATLSKSLNGHLKIRAQKVNTKNL